MDRRVGFIAAALCSAMLLAAGASATPITNPYTDFSSWEAALSGSPTDLNPNGNVPPGGQTSYTLDGFTFSGTNMDEEAGGFSGSTITITAPSGGETAMILYLGRDSNDNATSFTMTLSDNEASSSITIPGQSGRSLEWYGFTDITPITYLTVSTGNGTKLFVSDLQYGVAAQQDQGGNGD